MHRVVGIKLGVDVLDANRRIAGRIRLGLGRRGIKAIDFMGSIGSGKTLIIERLIDILKEKGKNCAVIAGDVAGDDDYRRFRKHGVKALNVNTGKECHLDAHMVEHALEKLDLDKVDVLFIENVGNLVCPADFPLGTDGRVVVISVTEGDDMVRKHPVIFGTVDTVVVNKADLAKYMEVDPMVLVKDVGRINPHAKVIITDAKHSTGIGRLAKALRI
jgi:hydrogenase nickel incorporation protein HypB